MKKLLSLLLVATVFATSCSTVAKLYVKNSTARTLKKTKLLIDSCGKEVILLPMCHVGKQERYDEIHAYLDSLKADGYVTFFEGVPDLYFHVDTISDLSYPALLAIRESITPTRSDTLRADTLRRKARRIVGVDIYSSYGQKYEELATQSAEALGMTTERDIWVDYTLHDLITLYEQRGGPIPLSNYDFQVVLNDPEYEKSKAQGRVNDWVFLHTFREDLLVRRIVESEHRKIAVVYGAGHIHFIRGRLHYLHGFEKIKKYNAKKAYPAK